ncbi:MAG TPA: hypothetical protein VGV87_19730 [Blastocatellia bacterium]|nr:hypothetical protein [Blastocatellia bacterium]
MRSQQLIRVAACATIMTLCVACAGFFPGQPVAGQDTSESSAVARQHRSPSVRWVPGFSILHQLEYCLSQRFGLYWFLPGCWLCDQDPAEINNQVPCAGRLDIPLTDE